MNVSPPALRALGRASTFGGPIISIAASEYELIDSPEPVVVAVASEKVTLPKSASEVSEHPLPLQSSGRSTIHSAEDWAAPTNVMEVVNAAVHLLVSQIESVHVLPDTLTEAVIESPEDTGFVVVESSSS
jgi:hypothetical protein